VRVVAIGAHPDDIEIGCGATLALHAHQGDSITMLVMTSGERGSCERRTRVAEQERASAILAARLVWGGFDDEGRKQLRRQFAERRNSDSLQVVS